MIALMLAAALASADAAPPELIEHPVWEPIVPEASDVPRFYPAEAQRQGIEGWAGVNCKVTDGGELTGCVVTGEEPASYGFGDALIQLSVVMRVGKLDKDGAPTAGRTVYVKTNFKLPPDD